MTGFRHSAIDWLPINRAPSSPNQSKPEDAFFKILVDNGSLDLSCIKSADGGIGHHGSVLMRLHVLKEFHVNPDVIRKNRARERSWLLGERTLIIIYQALALLEMVLWNPENHDMA